MNYELTRIRTLYFKSSGDGKIDGSLFGNGFVINWSIQKIKFNRSLSSLPPRISFKIRAICFCCSDEQWFSIFKITGYLNKSIRIEIFQNNYGDALKRFGSIEWIIDWKEQGFTSVYACVTIGSPLSPS